MFKFTMKIVSYNIRGLGGGVKRKAIKKIIREEGVDMLCVQETKVVVVDFSFCSSLWGADDIDWVSKPSVGNSGGLLICWLKSSFQVMNSFSGSGFIGVQGLWGRDKIPCFIVNVYSPC
jgi:exonuclease III